MCGARLLSAFQILWHRYINNLTDKEQMVTKELAYKIVLVQQQHLVISPWSLIAAVLMQTREGISFHQLIKEVEWLKQQVYNLGGYVDWPGNARADNVIHHYLGLHTNVISLDNMDKIELKLVRPAHVTKPVHDEVMLNAATNLILGSYRNQVLHVFVRVGLIALAVNSYADEVVTIGEFRTTGNLFFSNLKFQKSSNT
jgi:glycerol-3-phosphate O-acyltransferase